MTEPPASAGRPLLRAASVGLSLAALIGGTTVLVLGLRTLGRELDCGELQPAECSFEADTARELARWQLLFGLALQLLAAGGFLYLWMNERRARGRSPDDDPKEPRG